MKFLSHSLSGPTKGARLFQTLLRMGTENFAHINQRGSTSFGEKKNLFPGIRFLSSSVPESYTIKLLFETQRQSGTSQIIFFNSSYVFDMTRDQTKPGQSNEGNNVLEPWFF